MTSNKPNSNSPFLSALIANGSILALELLVFALLRQSIKRIYSPRTYLPPPEKRSKELPKGSWRWLPAILEAPSEDIMIKNSLDAYMFLRFIKMLIRIFFIFSILTFAIIVPVDYIGMHGAKTGLERITWTNIDDPKQQYRFMAHVIIVYILTLYVLHQIQTEMTHFIALHHTHLLTPPNTTSLQSRTVLITSVPSSLANEGSLRRFARGFVPGGIERVWVYPRDMGVLEGLCEERERVCGVLEKAVGEVVGDAWRGLVRRRRERRVGGAGMGGGREGRGLEEGRGFDYGGGEEDESESEALIRESSLGDISALMNDLVPHSKRPKHRTGLWGLVGPKVDTIEWCKVEIPRLNELIANTRQQTPSQETGPGHEHEGESRNVFVLCNSQIGASVLSQCVSYHHPLQMTPKYPPPNSPADIIWSNLSLNSHSGVLGVGVGARTRQRQLVSWAATLGLILTWGVPVAVLGSLSNFGKVCGWLAHRDGGWGWGWGWLGKGLGVVCRAPQPIPSIIQGVLPPLLLTGLFMLLPRIIRALARYECIPRYSLVSISVYRRLFLFQLIHGFFVVTLSSGITGAIVQIIDNPTHMVQQLAVQLPGASIFFLTYMVTKGFSGAGKTLTQFLPLFNHYMKKWVFDRYTPREVYNVKFSMPSADFGVVLPMLSLLATIGFAYSVLNPLINVLAFICFVMYYIAWKFLFSQVFDQKPARETGGLYFPMAVSNLFIGLYIEQICLTTLFFMKTGISESRIPALIQGSLMLVLLLYTVYAQVGLKKGFDPITKYLPMSLATEDSELAVEGEVSGSTGIQGAVSSSQTGQLQSTVPNQPQADSMLVDHDIAEERERGSGSGDTPNINEVRTLKTPSSVDEHAFDPPSTYVEQRCIWIPRDKVGFSRLFVDELKEVGVDASDEGAVLDEYGRVDVFCPPPGPVKGDDMSLEPV